MIELSKEAARTLLLAAQGLLEPVSCEPGSEEVLAVIRRMGILQIDTIHVVARSHQFVVWSRLGHYDPELIDRLLIQRRIFEGWSHAACFIPMEDFGLHRRLVLEKDRRPKKNQWSWTQQFLQEHANEAHKMLEFIGQKNTVKTSDFERPTEKSGGWWGWKDEKILLEALLVTGELMVERRERFHRVYALRSKVVPDWSDDRAPTYEDVISNLVAKSVLALGAAPAAYIHDYFRLARKEANPAIKKLAEAGEIVEVRIEGIEGPSFVHSENMALAKQAVEGGLAASRTTLLSPFDPVVWDRFRARTLFDFDYMIECYTPEPKRRYGYFTLPILHRDRLIGRVDAKAHRKARVFEIKALHLEPWVEASDEVVHAVSSAFRECAEWHNTPEVTIAKTDPARIAKAFRANLHSKARKSYIRR